MIAWRRALSEVVVIVGSIRPAFAVQAWWEGRQDAELEDEATATLLAEIGLLESRLDRAAPRRAF